jgi:recombination protein RecR
MMESLDRLMACFSRLPGVGRRSAERMAMRLVRQPDGLMADLIHALQQVQRSVRCCSRCGNVTAVEDDPCRLCTSPSRDGNVLCIVEDPSDIASIEASGGYRGRYHALMAKLSPLRGEGLANMRVKGLLQRLDEEKFEEVILATNTDVEGDATAAYLSELLQKRGVRVSRLAYGLPAGSGIAYSDGVTLARAIKGRQAV